MHRIRIKMGTKVLMVKEVPSVDGYDFSNPEHVIFYVRENLVIQEAEVLVDGTQLSFTVFKKPFRTRINTRNPSAAIGKLENSINALARDYTGYGDNPFNNGYKGNRSMKDIFDNFGDMFNPIK